jgi:hypothetical protein
MIVFLLAETPKSASILKPWESLDEIGQPPKYMKPQIASLALCACMAFSVVSCNKPQPPPPQPQKQQEAASVPAVPVSDSGIVDPNTGLPEKTQPPKDKHTAAQNNAALDFAFEGVKIGDTFASVKKRFPKMEFNSKDSDTEKKLAAWDVFDGLKTADVAGFRFQNGRLYSIWITFGYSTTLKKADEKTIYQNLVSTFGPEDERSETSGSAWFFQSAKIFVSYSFDSNKNMGNLWIEDLEAWTRESREKK